MNKKQALKCHTASRPVTSETTEDGAECNWNLVDVLSEKADWQKWAIKNTVQLLDDDNTVPFIARYRKESTNNMEAEKIRDVKEQLDYLRTVQNKVSSVYKAVLKLGKMTKEWKHVLITSRTLDEVEHLYAPYKPGSKGSLAERAKELGLESLALKILSDPRNVNLQAAIKPQTKGLATLAEVKKGIQHILADIVAKNKDIMEAVRGWCQNAPVMLKCSQVKTPAATKEKKPGKDQKIKIEQKKNHIDPSKFELYFNFSTQVRSIRPHQILAINRGVSQKVLATKIVIPDRISNDVQNLGRRMFVHHQADGDIVQLISHSINDAFTRLIEPLIVRHIKSDLTKAAEKASVEVFASNLKRLLLTPPVRGHIILGVDPGFRHGCKYASISVTGQVLDTGVFYPHTQSNKWQEVDKIRQTIIQHRCATVAIGNGTACRETESFFSEHIKKGTFQPVKVQFCIVNESGASIYSASPEAVKELPDMDVSLRGAVSIARRLQDPMAELVKIEPKHIGVGMYQHDIGESQLKTALDGVVEDCVSFVGVDLNVASEVLLKRIAGLTAATVKKIISHRETTGTFINREQLTSIKGLGPKTYKQCAGFVRVMPLSRGLSEGSSHTKSENVSKVEPENIPKVEVGKKRKAGTKAAASKSKKAKNAMSQEPNPLDMTSIHPESYDIADRLLSMAHVTKDDIGTNSCIDAINRLSRVSSLDNLAKELDTGVPTLTLITQALQQHIGHDIRDEFEKPLFKEGLKEMKDLKVGDRLSGRVTNMVHFGAFVDVGIGRDGLIHSSQMNPRCMNGKKGLELGDKVLVSVSNIDFNRGRLGLRLESLT